MKRLSLSLAALAALIIGFALLITLFAPSGVENSAHVFGMSGAVGLWMGKVPQPQRER